MEYFEKLQNFLNEFDRFAAANQMRITCIKEGYAEGVFTAAEEHRNGLNVVQGGAIYTFADFVFAGAANSFGEQAIGMNSNISYVRPGLGTTFKAVAKIISKGKRSALANVEVFDENEKLIAYSTMTGFFLGKPFFPENTETK